MDEFTSPPAPVQAGPGAHGALAGRAGTALWARVGLLGIGAAALLAAAILALGSGASPAGSLAAGTTANDNRIGVDLNGLGDGPRFLGGRGGFGPGFRGVTITAISGSNLSLETRDGWTRTIAVDSGTTYSKSGDTIALGDLAVGDEIVFRQTREDDGTWTIDAITVLPPRAGGAVTAVSGSTITVRQPDGSTATINVDGSTTFRVNGAAGSLTDVKVGMFLIAEGTAAGDDSLDAAKVRAGDPRAFRGPGERGFRGHRGLDGNDDPSSTATPSATGSGS